MRKSRSRIVILAFWIGATGVMLGDTTGVRKTNVSKGCVYSSNGANPTGSLTAPPVENSGTDCYHRLAGIPTDADAGGAAPYVQDSTGEIVILKSAETSPVPVTTELRQKMGAIRSASGGTAAVAAAAGTTSGVDGVTTPNKTSAGGDSPVAMGSEAKHELIHSLVSGSCSGANVNLPALGDPSANGNGGVPTPEGPRKGGDGTGNATAGDGTAKDGENRSPASEGGGSGEGEHGEEHVGNGGLLPPLTMGGGYISTPSVSPSTAGNPVSQTTNMLKTVGEVHVISETARVDELLNSAIEVRQKTQRDAYSDTQELAAPYKDMSLSTLSKHLERAQNNIKDALNVISGSTSTLQPSEAKIAQLNMLNAMDKTNAALGAIDQEQKKKDTLDDNTPFSLFKNDRFANPLAKSQELADIFGAQNTLQNAATADTLTNRIVMFNGLSPEAQSAALAKLKLVERTGFRTSGGEQVMVPVFHNGYLLGGGKTALDCSSFVSAILPPEVRKGRYTTLDFRAMWVYRKRGKLPVPPEYAAKRAEEIKQVADAFIPIDLYAGDSLMPGDLLIYRLLWEPIGHVFIVKNYHPGRLEAEVIEAAQSAGTIRERDFALSVDPMDRARSIRPGLMALRLRPVSNRACNYRDHMAAGGNGSGAPVRSPSSTGGGERGGAVEAR